MAEQNEVRDAFDEGFALSKLGGPIDTAWDRSEAKQAAVHPRWKSTMGRLYAQWLACLMQLREFEFHTKAFRTESARQIDKEVRAALAPDAPAALLTEDDCDRLAKDPATQRLYDLVRYSRGYLLDEGLITRQEYAYLVSTGSSSARRLETYDTIKGKA